MNILSLSNIFKMCFSSSSLKKSEFYLIFTRQKKKKKKNDADGKEKIIYGCSLFSSTAYKTNTRGPEEERKEKDEVLSKFVVKITMLN